jgi:cytochrome b subunit of formate dehydrogenase
MGAAMENGKKKMRRFSGYRILEHWGIILSTVVLFATGLCQRFWYVDSAQWFILKMSGIDNVRLIHRFAGVLFSIGLVLHIAVAVGGIVRGRWGPSMFIRKGDLLDAIHNIRYYFGLEEHLARCDRYDYMEKFEYWTILVGGVLMMGTGAVLWLPTLFTRLLPGESIPAAKALHSNEALLIFLINAIWHIYNAIFSPEAFPLDTTIFTGEISRERMLREHPIELAAIEGADVQELLGSGRKEAAVLKPDPESGIP